VTIFLSTSKFCTAHARFSAACVGGVSSGGVRLDYKEGRSFVNQVREVLRGTFFVCPALHDLDRFVERGTASLDEAGLFKVGALLHVIGGICYVRVSQCLASGLGLLTTKRYKKTSTYTVIIGKIQNSLDLLLFRVGLTSRLALSFLKPYFSHTRHSWR
jgi:hypothetical protein